MLIQIQMKKEIITNMTTKQQPPPVTTHPTPIPSLLTIMLTLLSLATTPTISTCITTPNTTPIPITTPTLTTTTTPYHIKYTKDMYFPLHQVHNLNILNNDYLAVYGKDRVAVFGRDLQEVNNVEVEVRGEVAGNGRIAVAEEYVVQARGSYLGSLEIMAPVEVWVSTRTRMGPVRMGESGAGYNATFHVFYFSVEQNGTNNFTELTIDLTTKKLTTKTRKAKLDNLCDNGTYRYTGDGRMIVYACGGDLVGIGMDLWVSWRVDGRVDGLVYGGVYSYSDANSSNQYFMIQSYNPKSPYSLKSSQILTKSPKTSNYQFLPLKLPNPTYSPTLLPNFQMISNAWMILHRWRYLNEFGYGTRDVGTQLRVVAQTEDQRWVVMRDFADRLWLYQVGVEGEFGVKLEIVYQFKLPELFSHGVRLKTETIVMGGDGRYMTFITWDNAYWIGVVNVFDLHKNQWRIVFDSQYRRYNCSSAGFLDKYTKLVTTCALSNASLSIIFIFDLNDVSWSASLAQLPTNHYSLNGTKLLTSPAWNNQFIFQKKFRSEAWYEQCESYVYRYDGVELVLYEEISTRNIAWDGENLAVFGGFVMSKRRKANDCEADQKLKAYKFDNINKKFYVAYQYEYGRDWNSFRFTVLKDVLIVNQYVSSQYFSIDQFRLNKNNIITFNGSFYRNKTQKSLYYIQFQKFLILQDKKLLLVYIQGENITQIYNLQKFPIQQKIDLSIQNKSNYFDIFYIPAKDLNKSSQNFCGYAYTYSQSQKTLYKFTDTCTPPYPPKTAHPLDPTSQYQTLSQLKLTHPTNKKYYIFTFNSVRATGQPDREYCRIEVRDVERLGIVWAGDWGCGLRYVDYDYGGMLVVVDRYDKVEVRRIYFDEPASQYGMGQITSLTASSSGCLTFSGPTLSPTQPPTTIITHKNTLQSPHHTTLSIPSTNLTLHSLDSECRYLALYLQDQRMIQVRNMQEEGRLLYSRVVSNVTRLRVLDGGLLNVEIGRGNGREVRLSRFVGCWGEGAECDVWEGVMEGVYGVSREGRYMGYQIDDLSVQLMERVSSNQQKFIYNKIGIFKLPYYRDQILSLLYSKNSTIYLLSTSPTAYIFDPSPCPQTFLSQNFYCTCPKNSTYDYINVRCTCPGGYVDNDTCVDCGFWCSACRGEGFQCQSYSAWFWVLIVGGSGVTGIFLVACCIGAIIDKYNHKKSNKKNLINQQQNPRLHSSQNKQILPQSLLQPGSESSIQILQNYTDPQLDISAIRGSRRPSSSSIRMVAGGIDDSLLLD